MKVFLRILGGLLMGAGSLWTLCTITSFLGTVQGMETIWWLGWLFWILVGIGTFFLGLWLFRKSKKCHARIISQLCQRK